MERRTFIRNTSSALLLSGLAPDLFAGTKRNDANTRLAMTTVTFRSRFEQTRMKNYDEQRGPLTLLDIPEYFADRFELHNLEFWSRHFESTDDAYLKTLKKRVKMSRAKLINIQLDGPYDLSDKDTSKREKSITFVKEWIDTASKVGAKGLRANPGKFEIAQSIASFKELAPYAKKKGVTLYAENHMGFGVYPENMVKVYQGVDHAGLKLLTDFANFDASVAQLAGIKTMTPYTGLVSAKALYIDAEGNHPKYDYTNCIQIMEQNGYKGMYSAEYYDSKSRNVDTEFIADWMLSRLRGATAP
jgi:sugar phosphate isomerase/epimerase